MNNGLTKAEKEVLRERLKSEKAVLKALEKQYETALKEIDDKIAALLGRNDANLPNVIHQVQYQRLIKAQVKAALDRLHSGEYETIEKYLQDSYTDGFVGTMYSLHRQDVPVIIPIEHEAAIKAVTIDSKLKEPLYESLGVDVGKLKKTISAEITRGIASGYSYDEIARGIARMTKAPLSRARTIVRTEAGRVQEQANFDAANKSKAAGADVVKQWSAILDGKTRDTHRELDHQIRELDKPFEIHGKKAMYPHDFGDPAEDCNCRCTLLTRARTALDKDELAVMQKRAEFFGLDKSDSFEDFKKKYLKAAETVEKSGAKVYNNNGTIDKIPNVSYIDSTYGAEHAKAVKSALDNADPTVTAVWNKYQEKFKTSDASYSGNKAFYSPGSDSVTLNIATAAKGSGYQTAYQVLYHEYGHMTDYLAARLFGYNSATAFTEVFNGLDENGKAQFVAKGVGGLLGRTAKNDLKVLIKGIKKANGVTTKAEAARILINEIRQNYSLIARSDVSDMLEGAGIGVSYPLGIWHGASYWKNRDNGKEIFAELLSAEAASSESLACIRKYFPETYKVFRDILEVIK